MHGFGASTWGRLARMEGRLKAGIHPGLVFAAAAAFALSRLGVHGLTFDEARIVEDARGFLSWILGTASTTDVWFGAERPSPAKVLAALGLVGWGPIPESLRVLPALLYAAAVGTLYGVLRRPRGWGALAAACALVVTPPIAGYASQCSNELVATSFLLVALARALTARLRREWFWTGCWLGLACGAKISGLVGVVALAGWAWRGAPPGSTARRGLAWVALGGVIGFLVTWPVLPLDPGAVATHVGRFAEVERPPLLFFGLRDAAPWHYAPFWILVGLPPLVVVASAWELLAGRGPLRALLAWFAVSGLVAGIAAAPWMREGVRHLLPLAAVLAVAAGLGAARIAGALRVGAAGWRGPAAALVVLVAGLEPTLRLSPAETGYVSPVVGGLRGAVRLGLPITSSGDVLGDEVLSAVPGGEVAVLPGAAADRPLYFGAPTWRRLVAARARAVTGRPIRIVTAEHADRLVVLGPARDRGEGPRSLGRPLVVRDGVVVAAWLPHPARLPLGTMEPGELEERIRGLGVGGAHSDPSR